MFSFIIEDYFTRCDKTYQHILPKRCVIFEPSHFKKRIMLTDSGKAVWKVMFKLCWALEPEKDKKNYFSDNNHDNSLHSLWTFCVVVWYSGSSKKTVP